MPRPDFMFTDFGYTGPYREVECGFHDGVRPKPAHRWARYLDTDGRIGRCIAGSTSVFNYVPVSLVYDLIKRHGGEAPPGAIGRPYRYTGEHMTRRRDNATRNTAWMFALSSSMLDELPQLQYVTAGLPEGNRDDV